MNVIDGYVLFKSQVIENKQFKVNQYGKMKKKNRVKSK